MFVSCICCYVHATSTSTGAQC